MKESIFEEGGRPFYIDDMKSIQDNALSLQKMLIADGCENFVLYGCKLSVVPNDLSNVTKIDINVSAGYVFLDNKIREVPAFSIKNYAYDRNNKPNVPLYIVAENVESTEMVEYKNTARHHLFVEYKAKVITQDSVPSGSYIGISDYDPYSYAQLYLQITENKNSFTRGKHMLPATKDKDGLMSKTDKERLDDFLDSQGIFECSTEGNATTKVIDNWYQNGHGQGRTIKVKMLYANTSTWADDGDNKFIGINWGGIKHKLYYNGKKTTSTNTWQNNEIIELYCTEGEIVYARSTTPSVATTTKDGFMSANDKSTLDKLETNVGSYCILNVYDDETVDSEDFDKYDRIVVKPRTKSYVTGAGAVIIPNMICFNATASDSDGNLNGVLFTGYDPVEGNAPWSVVCDDPNLSAYVDGTWRNLIQALIRDFTKPIFEALGNL